MLEEIKKRLLDDPEKIIEVLEHFEYCNIKNHGKYLSFGRDTESSPKSIVIRLENNNFLYVKDYAKNIDQDIFSYIMGQRHYEFKDVFGVVKNVLGITDYHSFFEKKGAFGGIYDRVKKKKQAFESRAYPDSVLDNYDFVPNLRFLRDHISILTQRAFNIHYDCENQAIVIPIFNQIGEIIGIKERFNWDVNIENGELKYFYELPCAMSNTLYGYSQNYEYLTQNTVLIFEAEKSVLQCHSYGIRNAVALGSGSISQKQIQMIYELNPTQIIFMHDVGYKYEYIMRNTDLLNKYSRFSEVRIGYWDFFDKTYPDKASPSDMGKEKFEYILANEITMIGDDDDEEL